MGGHGGLNILPQKRWNVYNFENREKVRKDEEAAAKEEQLKREESRKRDFELRLEQLRAARGLAPAIRATEAEPIGSGSGTKLKSKSESESKSKSKSNHMNLFEGLKEFDVIRGAMEDSADAKTDEPHKKKKKVKKEEATTRVVTAEDEKYRLGYGVAGKGVKLPWYLARPGDQGDGESGRDGGGSSRLGKEGVKSVGKKTLQELREERVKREKREKERELALVREKSRGDRGGAPQRSREFSRR